MFVFRKIWHALLFCTSVLRIALLPYYRRREALRDLVPFVQFKKSEIHQWRSVTFSKVTT